MTVAYSVYFRDAIVGASDNSGDRLWGVANFLAMAIVAVASPILGAFSDFSGRRKFFLIATTLQTVGATALLFFVGPGDVRSGIVLYVIATIGFEAGYVFYNAFLPDVSTPKTIGRVSGWAWAIGYAGGLLSLALCSPFIKRPLRGAGGAVDALAVSDRQASFVLVAVFFLVFALPSFLWLTESLPQGRLSGVREYTTVGFRRVADTLRHLRRYRETGKFVLASLFFTDGITTVISFSAIYATTTFHFSSADIVILFLVLNVVAFPGSLIAGYLADRIGPKTTLVSSLVLWILTILVGFAA
jgi:UMF1 family MFS transporter